MKRHERIALMFLVLLASIGCDQGTKRLAQEHLRNAPGHTYLSDSLRLQYAENPGAFLSMGADLPARWRQGLFTWGVGVLLLALGGLALLKQPIGRIELLAYALLLGGGLSNWVDRFGRDGTVVDFLNLGIGSLRTGIFNVADVAVVLGVALLAMPSVLTVRRADTG